VAGRIAKRGFARLGRRVVSNALVVRSVAYGESDLIVTLLTEIEGKVSAIVRGGRKGSRRIAGALEPMHTIQATYEDKGTDLVTLKEAHVVRARTGLMTRLEAMDAAGTALRWARHMFPPKTEEPAAFATLLETLDALDEKGSDPNVELAICGLRLLSDVGWGLELERCIVCGAKCPEDAAALLDPARGGIVCRKCGGARVLLRAPVRRAAITKEGVGTHAKALIEIVEAALAAHAGYGERH
jgi:DNA repair protein RecO (recombination protein O)